MKSFYESELTASEYLSEERVNQNKLRGREFSFNISKDDSDTINKVIMLLDNSSHKYYVNDESDYFLDFYIEESFKDSIYWLLDSNGINIKGFDKSVATGDPIKDFLTNSRIDPTAHGFNSMSNLVLRIRKELSQDRRINSSDLLKNTISDKVEDSIYDILSDLHLTR